MLPAVPSPAAPPSGASDASRPHKTLDRSAAPAVSIQVIRGRICRTRHARAADATPGRCFSIKARFALEMANTHSRIIVCHRPTK